MAQTWQKRPLFLHTTNARARWTTAFHQPRIGSRSFQGQTPLCLEDEAGTSACEDLRDHCPSRLKHPTSSDGERAATLKEDSVKFVPRQGVPTSRRSSCRVGHPSWRGCYGLERHVPDLSPWYLMNPKSWCILSMITWCCQGRNDRGAKNVYQMLLQVAAAEYEWQAAASHRKP